MIYWCGNLIRHLLDVYSNGAKTTVASKVKHLNMFITAVGVYVCRYVCKEQLHWSKSEFDQFLRSIDHDLRNTLCDFMTWWKFFKVGMSIKTAADDNAFCLWYFLACSCVYTWFAFLNMQMTLQQFQRKTNFDNLAY